MEEKATKTTTKRTASKSTAKAKTTTKAKATVAKTEEQVAPANPMEQLLAQMTPEMMAQLVQMISVQNQPQTIAQVPTKQAPQRVTKAYLNSIRDEEVEVRSVCSGTVVFKSQKTGMTYKWTGKDEVEVMTIGEVMAMNNASNKFLTTPWLVVDHEELNIGLGLQKLNDSIGMIDDLEDFLSQPIQDIKETIEALPKGYRSVLAEQIAIKVSNNEIRDYVLIRELEKVLNKEFIID